MDVGGRKCVLFGRLNGFELVGNAARSFSLEGAFKGSSHPFADRQINSAGCTFDVAIFAVLQNDLQLFSHIASLDDSVH